MHCTFLQVAYQYNLCVLLFTVKRAGCFSHACQAPAVALAATAVVYSSTPGRFAELGWLRGRSPSTWISPAWSKPIYSWSSACVYVFTHLRAALPAATNNNRRRPRLLRNCAGDAAASNVRVFDWYMPSARHNLGSGHCLVTETTGKVYKYTASAPAAGGSRKTAWCPRCVSGYPCAILCPGTIAPSSCYSQPSSYLGAIATDRWLVPLVWRQLLASRSIHLCTRQPPQTLLCASVVVTNLLEDCGVVLALAACALCVLLSFVS